MSRSNAEHALQHSPDSQAAAYCCKCDYILTGLTSPRCPECGQPFDPSDSRTWFDAPNATIRRRIRWLWTRRCDWALLILVPIELGAALLAYETQGEMDCWLLLFAVVVCNAIAATFPFIRLPRVSLGLIILIAVAVIPVQAWLGIRLLLLQYEASRIIAYSEDHQARFGVYPFDLRDYTFAFGSNREYIQSYDRSSKDGGYIFYWYVSTPTTSHWYSPSGGFMYYPD